MEGSYPLYCKDRTIGSVAVQKAGMFVRIVCNGRAPDNERYRLILRSKAAIADLGLFNGHTGEISAQIPLKQAGEPPYRFCLETERTKQFIAIDPDRPFSAISQLEKARFAVCSGQPGVLFTDRSQVPQDNGQSQEPQSI